MKTNVLSFVTPEAKVRFSNVTINPEERTASFTLSTKAKRARKWTEEQITSTITAELYNYLTLMRDDQVKVPANNERGYDLIKTGTKSTSFMRYLKRREMEFASGVLKSMVFECDNTSEDYYSNPFRLVRYVEGNSVLTLVNVQSKSRKETVDVETGEVSVKYATRYGQLKDGTTVKAFIMPKNYRRLVVQENKEVEVFEPAV